jgi:ribosomal protein S18 acetylase RimI-like enzyme
MGVYVRPCFRMKSMDCLLNKLKELPIQNRHALGILDSEYAEWRPEGKPAYRLQFVGALPLLMIEPWDTCMVLDEPNESEARQAAEIFRQSGMHELSLRGEAAFRAMRAFLAEGSWRMSRDYGLIRERFRPRPSQSVRRLGVQDWSALRRLPELGESKSMLRDFGYMEQGLPVVCYGAFQDGLLVGFCSTNPICCGVTEISWIVVASGFRRRGLAAGLLTAACEEAFARDDAVGYYAGSAGDDLDAMVHGLGFEELAANYRFIPASSVEQWRTWGRPVSDQAASS